MMTFCSNCKEYKGIVTCDECGSELCLFCDDWCQTCGRWVNLPALGVDILGEAVIVFY